MQSELESLRTQYEAQVQALRDELEQERKSQGRVHHGDGIYTTDLTTDVTSDVTSKVMTSTDRDLAQAEAALREHLLSQLRVELEESHRDEVSSMQQALSESVAGYGELQKQIRSFEERIEEQRDIIERQRDQILTQNAFVEEQKKQFEGELTLQLQAQRITLEGVNKSQQTLLQEDLRIRHQDEVQQLQTQIINNKLNHQDFEEEQRNAIEQIKKDLQERFTTDLAQCRSECEVDKVSALQQLRSELQEQYRSDLNALQVQLDAEKDDALSIKLLQEDLSKRHQDEVQQLQKQIASDKLNHQEFEEEQRNAIEQIKKELQERFTTDLVQCRSECEGDKVSALQQLRTELEEQYKHDLSDLQVQLDAEKHDALSKLRSDLEEAKSETLQSQLDDIEAKHAKALEDLHDELSEQNNKAILDLRVELDEQYSERMDALKDGNTESLRALKELLEEEKSAELDKLRTNLEVENDRQLLNLRSMLEQEKTQDLQNLQEELEAKKEEEINNLKNALDTAVAEVEVVKLGLLHERDLALQDLKEQHETHVSQLTKDWEQRQQEQSSVAGSKESSSLEKVEELEAELKNVRSEYETELENLNKEIDSLKKQVSVDSHQFLRTPRSGASTAEFEDGVLGDSQNSFRVELIPGESDFMYVESDEEEDESTESKSSTKHKLSREATLDTELPSHAGKIDKDADLTSDDDKMSRPGASRTESRLGYDEVIEFSDSESDISEDYDKTGVFTVVKKGLHPKESPFHEEESNPEEDERDVSKVVKRGLMYEETFEEVESGEDENDDDHPALASDRTGGRREKSLNRDLMSFESDSERDEKEVAEEDIEEVVTADNSGENTGGSATPVEASNQMVTPRQQDAEEGEETPDIVDNSEPPYAPRRNDLPIVVIQHSDDVEPSAVHDFYETLEDLEAIDVGSDKKWIKHLESRLEDYEEEMDSMREKMLAMKDEHLLQQEETGEKIREYEEEIHRLLNESYKLRHTEEELTAQVNDLLLQQALHDKDIASIKDSSTSPVDGDDQSIQLLEDKIQHYEIQIADLQTKTGDREKQIEELLSELGELRENERESNRRVEELEVKLTSVSEDNEHLKMRLRSVGSEHIALEERCLDYEKALDDSNRKNHLLRQENEELHEKLKLCEQELEEVKDEASASDKKYKNRIQEQVRIIDENTSKINNLERQINTRHEDEKKLVDHAHSLQAEVDLIKETHEHNLETIKQDYEDKLVVEMNTLQDHLQERFAAEMTVLKEKHAKEIDDLQGDIERLKDEHERSLSMLKHDHENKILQEMNALQDHLEQAFSAEKGVLKNEHAKELQVLHRDLEKLKDENESNIGKLNRDHDDKIVKEMNDLQDHLESRFVVEINQLKAQHAQELEAIIATTENQPLVGYSAEMELHEKGIQTEYAQAPDVSEEYVYKIQELEDSMNNEVAMKTKLLEVRHERELDQVRTAVQDYGDEFERLKLELSDSYARELDRILKKHEEEQVIIAVRHKDEMNQLHTAQQHEHSEKILELTVEMTVQHAQELAVRKLKYEFSQYHAEPKQQNAAFHDTPADDPFLVRGPSVFEIPNVDISNRDQLEAEYKLEMEKVKAELEEMYSESREELREELDARHGAELHRIRVDLLQQHQAEMERVNIELFAVKEELDTIQADLELKYQSEIQTLRNKCEEYEYVSHQHQQQVDRLERDLKAAKDELQEHQANVDHQRGPEVQKLQTKCSELESDISMLHQEIEDLVEEKSQAVAKHTEDLENLKNDMSRRHGEELVRIQLDYDQVLLEKETVLRSEISNKAEENVGSSEDIDQLHAEKDSLIEELDIAMKIRDSLATQLEQLNVEHENLKHKHSELNTTKENVISSLQDIEDVLSRLKDENRMIGQERATLLNRNKLLEADIEELKENCRMAEGYRHHEERLDEERRKLEYEWRVLHDEKDDLENDRRRSNELKEHVEEEWNKVQYNNSVLEDELKGIVGDKHSAIEEKRLLQIEKNELENEREKIETESAKLQELEKEINDQQNHLQMYREKVDREANDIQAEKKRWQEEKEEIAEFRVEMIEEQHRLKEQRDYLFLQLEQQSNKLDALRLEREQLETQGGDTEEMNAETSLIPVVEELIQPEIASLCGDDSDEEAAHPKPTPTTEDANTSEVTDVTEDIEEDMDAMSDTFESLTQGSLESSGESLKAELEAAEDKVQKSLSFNSSDEEDEIPTARQQQSSSTSKDDAIVTEEDVSTERDNSQDRRSDMADVQNQLKAAESRIVDLTREIQEQERKLEDLQQQFTEEKAKAELEHRQAMDGLRTEHDTDITAMKDKHEKDLLQLVTSPHAPGVKANGAGGAGEAAQGPEEESLEEEYVRLRVQEHGVVRSHEQLLHHLKQEHLSQLDTVKYAVKEELLAENMRKFEEMTGNLEHSHQAEMEELRKELDQKYQDQIHFLEEELERSNDDAEKALREMRDKYEREIETLRDATREHSPGGVDDPGGGAVQQDKLARLIQQHEGELQELEQEHQQKLGVVERFHADALEKQKREAEQRLAAELERLHQQLEDEKQDEVRRVQDSLQEQISDLKRRLEDSPQDLPDGTEEELTRRMDQIGRLSELLSERGEDLSKSQENISHLEKQLKDNKEDYELLSARWEAMEQGDLNRDRLMQADLEQVTRDRDGLQQANNRLLQILSETVNTNLVAEERINRQLARLVAEGRVSSGSGSHRESGVGGDSDLPSSSAKGGEEETLETSAISIFSDEGLDLSQRINESVFAGPDIDPDGEEIIMDPERLLYAADAGSRLQHAVERLLDMFVTSTRQLHDAQSTQRDLVSSLTSRAEEAQNLGVQVDDLQQRLRDESDAKAFLAVELNKAEGLLQGYSDEKRQLEDALAILEEKKEELIIDLEHAQSQLRQIAEVEDEITARETALERQQHTLERSLNEEDQVDNVAMTNEVVVADAGLTQSPPLAKNTEGLLHEVQKVLEEKRDVQRQADKEREIFEARTEELEQMVEEQQMTYEEQLEQKKLELDDLMHKVDDMEKKSKSNNLFLEEQTLEREQEREEFQREVLRLKALVKDKEKSENAENRLHRELAELEDQLSERTTLHTQTLMKKEEVERELANQEANVRTLQEMIRQLEEELEAKTREEQQVREKLDQLEADLAKQQEVSQELTGELKKSIPQDELKRLVSDLESQLETIQKSEKLASQKVYQKDEELRNMKTMEEELQHDKTSLQQQVHSQLSELSSLRTQMEEMKLSAARQDHDAQIQAELRQLLSREQEALEKKTREIEAMEVQLDALRRELLDKTELVQQLEAQLDVSETERRHQLAESTRRTSQLHDEKSALQQVAAEKEETLEAEIRSLREKIDSTPMQVLTQALLDEKNDEIDDLTEQLARLREQLNNSNTQQEVERLTKEVEERRTEVRTQGDTIDNLEDEIAKMKEDADLMSAVKDAEAEKDRKLMAKIQEKNDRIQVLEQEVSERQEDLTHLETQTTRQVKQLQDRLQQKDTDMVKMMEDYEAQRESDLNSLQDTIREREATIDDMSAQVDSLQHEITGLRDFQAKLQEDFDTVQNMLEQKQREIEVLTREVTPQTDNVSELKRYEAEVLTLQKEVRVKQATIEEREEQLYTLQEQAGQVEVLQRDVEDLREALDVKERLLIESQDENRTLEDRLRLLEADNSDDANMRLHEQIQAQESLIEQLQDELSLSHSNLKARQDEFNRALSELEQQQVVPQMVQQVVQPVTAAPPPQQNMEHVREQLRQEYEQRLNHKILELESSHKHQVEALWEQFDVERRTLREETRREMEKRHSEELNQLVLQHQEELSRLRHAIDLSDDDSVIEAGRRLQAEIERGERIDSRVYHQYVTRPPTSPGPEQDTDTRLMHILNNVEAQGVRILSLSEMETLRRHVQQTTGASQVNTSALQQAWEAEKHALLAAVQSLKDLLAQTQYAGGAARDDDSGADWRADLLRAICYVFAKERDGLLAELRTHVVTHGHQDSAAVHQLEQHMKEMDVQHSSAMKQIFSADRQSMLAELRDLRAHLSVLRLEKQDERGKLAEQLGAMEEQFTKRERQLRRQLELMEYKIQQEKVMADDLRSSLEIEKSRTMELSSQLSREKNSTADLQSDLVDAQTQLAKLKDAFEREQARLVSASSALEEERGKTAELTEALTIEQMSASQVTEQLKSEQLRSKQQQDRSKQLTEKLRREVETERERYGEATTTVERERMTSSSLRRELDLNREQLRTSEAKFKVKVAELRSSAEAEKARNDELNTALQRERQLVAALRDSLEEERGSKDDLSAREQAAISDLQAMLDLERSKLLDLQMSVERERRKVSSLNSQLDLEQTKAQDALELERATCRQLKVSLESLQAQKAEVSQQLVFVQEKAAALEEDRTRLQHSLRDAQQQARQLEAASSTTRVTQRQHQRRLEEEADAERQRQHDADAEITRLRQKAAELQQQLSESQRAERSAREQLDLLQLSLSPPTPEDMLDADKMEFYKRQLETLRQRLHVIVNRHQEELTRMLRTQFGSAGSSSESLDGSSRPELESIARILREILSELQQVHGVIVHDSDTASHTSPKREEFLSASYYRMEVEAAEDRLATERVSWSEERGALTLQLHHAEKEINNIKNKLRKTEIQLEREREKYITPVQTAGSVDKEKMQRLYGKYLRAESFRKALVYQKKYLLLLLGGFQDCEEQTLSEIAKMGVYPAAEDVMRRTRHPRPYSRFRSAVRVVIAVSRMKYLVKKWQRASRVGSPAVTGSSSLQNGTGSYVPTTGGFAQPRRHYSATSHPLTNGRLSGPVSRSDPYMRSVTPDGRLHTTPPTRDISAEIAAARSADRSVLSTGSARRQLLNDEDGGDAASQDSSLDDYISRLEHIQVRLSTVNPSATSPTYFVR